MQARVMLHVLKNNHAALWATVIIAAASVAVASWRATRPPAWKSYVTSVASRAWVVQPAGKIPIAVQEQIAACQRDLLPLDDWSSAEAALLFEMLDRGLSDMNKHPESSADYAWAHLVVDSPIEVIGERFRAGAPIEPEVVRSIQDRLLILMEHPDVGVRLSAESTAWYGYMENRSEIRNRFDQMVHDDEPVIAAFSRRLLSELKSPAVVGQHEAAWKRRGY